MRLLFAIKSNVRCRCRWLRLTLITAAELTAAVRTLNLGGHAVERDLADAHSWIERNWQTSNIP
jgi:hypothetical protein